MKNTLDREAQRAIVSDNLKKLREKRYPGHGGKKQVAEAMGLKIQQWSPWEKGQRMPSEIRLEKIAQFFGVPIEYMWTDHRTTPAAEVAAEPPPPAPKSNDVQIADAVKEQLRTALQLNNVMAILKLKFSVVDVEIVTVS